MSKVETRMIPVPHHRIKQLREHWMEIFTPITVTMKLKMRTNLKTKRIEIQTNKGTETEHPSGHPSQKRAEVVTKYSVNTNRRKGKAYNVQLFNKRRSFPLQTCGKTHLHWDIARFPFLCSSSSNFSNICRE